MGCRWSHDRKKIALPKITRSREKKAFSVPSGLRSIVGDNEPVADIQLSKKAVAIANR